MSKGKSKSKSKSKSKRKALGEEPLGKRGVLQDRYLVSKRRISGEDPYAWIEGKKVKEKVKSKRKRKKMVSPAKRQRPYKLKAKKIVKEPKLPAKIWNKLKKVKRGMKPLLKEVMAVTKTTRKAVGRATADTSRTITSRVVTGQKVAGKIIRKVQLKFKASLLKGKMERLFAVLGEECYQLIGKKRNILKEKKIQSLINEIKKYQRGLQKRTH